MNLEITLKQYEDIYRVVASIGHHFSHGAGRSCQFYNVYGAFILEKILEVDARPVMGAAFVRLNKNGDTVSFAGQENGDFYSSQDAFHCWIETPNYFIDFTAPEYREAVHRKIDKNTIPRQMFQKRKSTMSSDAYSMTKPGDYFFCVNKELTNHLLKKMFSTPDAQDFANICCDWYLKYKEKKIESISIMDDLGETTPISLKNSNLRSAW